MFSEFTIHGFIDHLDIARFVLSKAEAKGLLESELQEGKVHGRDIGLESVIEVAGMIVYLFFLAFFMAFCIPIRASPWLRLCSIQSEQCPNGQ